MRIFNGSGTSFASLEPDEEICLELNPIRALVVSSKSQTLIHLGA